MNTQAQITPLEQFWSAFEKKTWVVSLACIGRRNRTERRDTKYVTARTEAGAISTAIENSFINPNHAHARLAHPVKDLGCVWSGEGDAPL